MSRGFRGGVKTTLIGVITAPGQFEVVNNAEKNKRYLQALRTLCHPETESDRP